MNPDPIQNIEGSYRDPDGFVFRSGGRIHRAVRVSYLPHLEHLERCGLAEELTGRGALLSWQTVAPPPHAPACARVLLPEQLAFISHPGEWSFSQWRDAALLTLDIQLAAVAKGMTLKDASPFNVQLHRGRPVFIDTLSFAIRNDDEPWNAYRQFCELFLAPLLWAAYRGPEWTALMQAFPDGLPLRSASSLLPLRSWFSPCALFHIHLHARTAREAAARNWQETSIRMSRASLIRLLVSLREHVSDLRLPVSRTEWSHYYAECAYGTAAMALKREQVARWVEQCAPATAWDLGANTGEFSMILHRAGAHTVALDIDPLCTDLFYRRVVEEKLDRLHPLRADLANPPAAIGWMNRERPSLFDRGGRRDLVLALALIHHLAIGRNVPLDRILDLFRSLGRNLVVEFVPKDDPQTQRLLRSRPDIFPDYARETFEDLLRQRGTIREAVPVPGSGRVLYFHTSHD
jgi:hypothetical protein